MRNMSSTLGLRLVCPTIARRAGNTLWTTDTSLKAAPGDHNTFPPPLHKAHANNDGQG